MSKRVLCKFFAHGACLKGEHCEYSHDWKDPPNNVCTFYQKGACSFGSRCRYNHVKVSRPQSSASSSSINSHHTLISDSAPPAYPPRTGSSAVTPFVASSRPLVTPTYPAWNQESRHHDYPDSLDFSDGVDFPESIDVGEVVEPAEKPICSFAAAGSCPRGEKCPHVHGELCPTCGKHCLHPLRPDEREEHMRICGIRQKHLEALKHSQEIECSVCLERVLLKPTPAERKFGLLSECDHPFCISCIRNWRSSSPSSGMDVNSALRSCPICRKLSYFVIPSVIWYCTKEEKQEIVESYKAKLRSIDCKYFDFGNGACPFGTSCFYKHTVKPGSYTWNNLRPPSPPRGRRSNMMGMEDILAMLEQLDAYSELEGLESFDPEDLGSEALTPEEMSLLLMPMGLDTNEDPSEMALLLGQLGVYDSDDDL